MKTSSASGIKAKISLKAPSLLVWTTAALMLFATSLPVGHADAERMDLETHRFLIEKLETVIKETPRGDTTRVPALLRLADLFSERARLLSMQEIEAGCFDSSQVTPEKKTQCLVSKDDRRKAISYYEMALAESSGASQSRILFHLAHLYEMNGDNKKAESLYRRILSLGPKHFTKAVLGQSQAGLGEIAFREKRFSEAKRQFELSLLNSATPRKGWIHYRIAWSDLNLGRPEAGKQRLLGILKNPSLLALESSATSDGVKPDASFQEDIARDLTIFYARTGFTRQDIEVLWTLSPEVARKDIMVGLAEESERLGQRRSAIDVWSVVATRTVDSNRERVEAFIRIANLRFGLGDKAKAVGDYRMAIDQWKKGKCEPLAECELLQKRFRKLVLDWNKNEETKLTANLLEMYKSYVGTFPQDAEMAFWGASVARNLGAKNRGDALSLYRTASVEAAKIMKSDKESEWDKNLVSVFEGSLISEIELSEQSKDLGLRESAYRHYLALNADGPKVLEVKYQIAHVTYTRGETAKAGDLFFEIAARDEKCRVKSAPTYCRQAADLALDSVALQRNDSRLEAMGEELASLYPAAQAEYLGVARRARLNLAAKAAGSGSSSEMNDNLKRLKNLNLKGASNDEILLTHRNRFVLAEKTRNFDEASAAAVAVINFKGASADQREDAMAKRLWVAEMQLDFPTAYVTAKQMSLRDVSKVERALKLSLLAELAGRDARPHLREFVSLSGDRRAQLAARVNLVKLSGFSEAEFNRQYSFIKSDSRILASLGLEVYARNPSRRLADRLLAVPGVARTEEGSVLVRSRELKSLIAWSKRLEALKLPVQSGDRALQKALSSRIAELQKADVYANKMIKTGDVWLQALALQTVANENRRLKNEITALPAPAGLKESDLKRYQMLVQKQVQPFEVKSVRVADKVQKFWKSNPAETVGLTIEKNLGSKRNFLSREATVLANALETVGQDQEAKRVRSAIESDAASVRQSAIESARNDVKEDPFDVDSIRRLRELEAKLGRETMVAYLDSRMSRMGVKP
jgi:tetratricopeptide (TPR) repeat protein